MSFFRVSGVPQKGEARTPLTRKKDITRTKSSHKTRSLTRSPTRSLTLTRSPTRSLTLALTLALALSTGTGTNPLVDRWAQREAVDDLGFALEQLVQPLLHAVRREVLAGQADEYAVVSGFGPRDLGVEGF